MAGKKRGERENSPSHPTGVNHSDRSDGSMARGRGRGPSLRLQQAASQPTNTKTGVCHAKFCCCGEAELWRSESEKQSL